MALKISYFTYSKTDILYTYTFIDMKIVIRQYVIHATISVLYLGFQGGGIPVLHKILNLQGRSQDIFKMATPIIRDIEN